MLAISHNVNNEKYIYRVLRIILVILPEHPSDIFTMKMEILLESTSNKLMVDPHGFEDSHKDGHGVKEFQRSFSHSDTERLSRSDEVLKLKNFKKDAALKPFKSTNQERYEHVGPKVTSSQDGKVYKKAKRDYAWLMVQVPPDHIFTYKSIKRNKLKPKVNDHYTIFIRK
ncbi:hypothetical protein Tco_1517575 [Tanacetum coccineum]